jgi:hypothetical protein
MTRDPNASIIITDGYWMHIRHTQVHHRRYPEVRGEGRSLADAAGHLINQLTRALDSVHGHKREAVEKVLADVRAIRSSRPRPEALAAVR